LTLPQPADNNRAGSVRSLRMTEVFGGWVRLIRCVCFRYVKGGLKTLPYRETEVFPLSLRLRPQARASEQPPKAALSES